MARIRSTKDQRTRLKAQRKSEAEVEELQNTIEKLNKVIEKKNDRISELEVLLYGEVQD